MSSRSFIAGAACGALVGLATGWILASSNERAEPAVTARQPAAAAAADVEIAELGAPERSMTAPAVDQTSSSETSARLDTAAEDDAALWPASQWQEIDLEPKEESWAYYMEQALSQYLGSHPAAAQFDVSRLECRTTMCQVEVVGYDASTEPVWQQVMYDIRHQSWSEFARYGSSSGDVDGHFVLIGTFWRVPTEQ